MKLFLIKLIRQDKFSNILENCLQSLDIFKAGCFRKQLAAFNLDLLFQALLVRNMLLQISFRRKKHYRQFSSLLICIKGLQPSVKISESCLIIFCVCQDHQISILCELIYQDLHVIPTRHILQCQFNSPFSTYERFKIFFYSNCDSMITLSLRQFCQKALNQRGLSHIFVSNYKHCRMFTRLLIG